MLKDLFFCIGIEAWVIPMGCDKKSKDALAKLSEFGNLIDMYFITGESRARNYNASLELRKTSVKY